MESKISGKAERMAIRKQVNKRKIMQQLWTEGVPPYYKFARGDMLHHRDGIHIIQVVAPGYAQVIDGEPPLSAAAMKFAYVNHIYPLDGLGATLYRRNEDGQGYRALYTVLCDQQGFAALLREGINGL